MSRPPNTAGRLRRLLAILAWLAQEGEAPIDEVASRFDLTPQALVTELEMAACCGVPPYTPDQLMEIVVTDTTVATRVGTALARPRRLSPHEGFALAASARALLAIPGSDEGGALSRALAKLDRALGGEEIAVELDAPVLLAVVRDATAARQRLAISYYSASTDRVTEREIDAIRLFASEGHWYVDAWCNMAGGVRRFRVDRISAAEVVAGHHRAADAPPGGLDGRWGTGDNGYRADTADAVVGEDDATTGFDVFVPGPDNRSVRLSLDPSTAWLVESIPSAGPVTEVDGRIEVEFFVGGHAWLERLLLRLGPDARVVEPPDYRNLAADAAARILRRYEDSN
jgi:predicted DNA-binding transcriptional regulator YafY